MEKLDMNSSRSICKVFFLVLLIAIVSSFYRFIPSNKGDIRSQSYKQEQLRKKLRLKIEDNINYPLAPIHKAIIDGDHEQVMNLIKEGVNIELVATSPPCINHGNRAPDCTGYSEPGTFAGTPLMFAIAYGQEEIVLLLIDDGANVNVIGRLLGKKRDHQLGSIDIIPLQLAIRCREDNIVRILLEKGAFVDFTPKPEYLSPLVMAALWSAPNVVIMLLEHGADPNYPDGGYSLLEHLSWDSRKRMGLIRQAFRHGADPNSRLSGGTPLLIMPCCFGHKEFVELLVEKGADVNAIDEYGNSAYAHAIKRGYNDIATYLLSKGAKPRWFKDKQVSKN
jgi:ankyrin repeat protein